MVNLADRTIQLASKLHPMVNIEVWFRTPVGLNANLDIAVEKCKQNDWDTQCIVAVPVAIGPDGIYEELVR